MIPDITLLTHQPNDSHDESWFFLRLLLSCMFFSLSAPPIVALFYHFFHLHQHISWTHFFRSFRFFSFPYFTHTPKATLPKPSSRKKFFFSIFKLYPPSSSFFAISSSSLSCCCSMRTLFSTNDEKKDHRFSHRHRIASISFSTFDVWFSDTQLSTTLLLLLTVFFIGYKLFPLNSTG